MPNRTALYDKGIGVPLSQSLTLLLFLSIGSALLVSAQTVRKGELSARQIAQRTFPSVVVLVAEDRSGDKYLGSGFFVDRDVVATNYHVIKGATKIIARGVGKKRVYQVSILSTDEESDLALLRVQGAVARPLTLARGGRIAVGDVVYVAGNPEGLEGTFSQGIVSALRGKEYVQITAAISHGSSGGPVLNSRGEVIGVAIGTLEEGQNLNFAIPILRLSVLIARPQSDFDSADEAIAKLDGRKVQRTPSSRGSKLPNRPRRLGDQADAYAEEGHRLFVQEKYTEAADAFKDRLRLKPEDGYALLGLAHSYNLLRKYPEAIDIYNTLIRLPPEENYQSLAMFGLADVYEKQNIYHAAMGVYNELIQKHPKEEGAYIHLASLLAFKLKRYDEGIEVLRNGIAHDSKSYDLYDALARVFIIQDRMPEAEAVLKSAVQQSDSQASAYFALGVLYCDDLKRCKDSIYYYKLAVEKSPDDDFFHFCLGQACLKADNRPCAIREYQYLKTHDPAHAEQLFNEIYK